MADLYEHTYTPDRQLAFRKKLASDIAHWRDESELFDTVLLGTTFIRAHEVIRPMTVLINERRIPDWQRQHDVKALAVGYIAERTDVPETFGTLAAWSEDRTFDPRYKGKICWGLVMRQPDRFDEWFLPVIPLQKDHPVMNLAHFFRDACSLMGHDAFVYAIDSVRVKDPEGFKEITEVPLVYGTLNKLLERGDLRTPVNALDELDVVFPKEAEIFRAAVPHHSRDNR